MHYSLHSCVLSVVTNSYIFSYLPIFSHAVIVLVCLSVMTTDDMMNTYSHCCCHCCMRVFQGLDDEDLPSAILQ